MPYNFFKLKTHSLNVEYRNERQGVSSLRWTRKGLCLSSEESPGNCPSLFFSGEQAENASTRQVTTADANLHPSPGAGTLSPRDPKVKGTQMGQLHSASGFPGNREHQFTAVLCSKKISQNHLLS